MLDAYWLKGVKKDYVKVYIRNEVPLGIDRDTPQKVIGTHLNLT